jgi:hypothetical protein
MDDHGQIGEPLRVDAVLVCASCGKQMPHDFHFPSWAAAPVHKCQLCGTTDRPVRRFVRPTRGADDAAAARAEPVVPAVPPSPSRLWVLAWIETSSTPGHPLLIQVHHDRASARCLCGWGLSNATTLKTVHDGHRQHAQKAAGQGGGAQWGSTPYRHINATRVRDDARCLACGWSFAGTVATEVWERAAAHRRSGLKRPKTAKDTMRGSARKGRQRSRGRRSRQ